MKRCAGNLVLSLAIAAASLPLASAGARESVLAEVAELFELREYDDARRVLEELPGELRTTGQGCYYAGRLGLIDGDPESAVGFLEEAVALDPEESEYHHWLATALLRRAVYRSFIGRTRDAMRAGAELRGVSCTRFRTTGRGEWCILMTSAGGRGRGREEDRSSEVTEGPRLQGSGPTCRAVRGRRCLWIRLEENRCDQPCRCYPYCVSC